MIPREIVGPQDRFERTGAQALRDVRPITTRLSAGLVSEFSGVVLAVAGGAMAFEPASVDLVVPSAIFYAALVLTRRVKLPMRLPKSARIKDWNHPDPATRRPRQASGTIYLGRDVTGKELWISPEDGRQHATIPGTTGAGKTTAILSFLANALTHASGFVLVDGKADNKLFKEVLALARRFGREDDVLHLNLLVASGGKDSNTFNPFAVGNADAIREMVVSQLGEQSAGNDSNGVFRSRAVALIGAVVPVLTWIRDHENIAIDIEKIRDALELRVIWKLAHKGIFELRNAKTGKVTERPVDIPEDIIYPLKAYLGEIPGYDTALDYNKQKSDEPSKQHGFARFYFTATFTQLAVSLGHIFKVEQGDIDMSDVVLNRRILVVSLPALENSSDSLAGLGKIVVGSLRGMMAQMLNSPVEMLDPSAPFQVVLDELAYYATGDLDRMLAQGRSLNMMFWLAFQEVSGIVARIGEKTQTLLGNANLTVAMRQQDANRTREWIEQTAGQTLVTQAAGYQGAWDGGEYRDTRQADVRQVARVDWNDLQRLIEGEAIILFGGRRIYARLFHAKFETSGPARLTRPLSLPPPDTEKLEAERERNAEIAGRIEKGMVAAGAREPVSSTLKAMLEGFAVAGAKGGDAAACVAGAIEAAGRIPFASTEPGTINTPFTPMLESAIEGTPGPSIEAGRPANPIDATLVAGVTAVETAIGASKQTARAKALDLLARRDEALRSLEKSKPPELSADELRQEIHRLINELAPGAEIERAAPKATQSKGMAP